MSRDILPLAALASLALLSGCRDGKGPSETGEAPDTDSDSGAPVTDSTPDSAPDTGQAPVSPFTLSATPKNLLVVSIDTLRRDAVGALSGGENTPFIDSLASEGVLLTHHHSCSAWTYPGSICAMAGVEPEDLGFVPSVPEADEELPRVPEGTPTLATTLSEQGFQTGLITSNLYLGAGSGLGAGFDVQVGTSGIPADAITDAATAMFSTAVSGETPWFVHVHYVDPHAPYSPPEEYLTGLEGLPELPWDLGTDDGLTALNAAWSSLTPATQADALTELDVRYSGEVRFVDAQIQRLFETLDAGGWLDDTLVLFWSDHGEQFYEHGGRGHTISLYGEENDGLAMFWSRKLSRGTWAGGTTNVDLMPTALWLLDIYPPEGLVGEIVGTSGSERGLFSMLAPLGRPPIQSVQVGASKLIYRWDGKKVLFHRDEDPSETESVYDEEPEEVEALWELLLPRVERAAPLVSDWTPESTGP